MATIIRAAITRFGKDRILLAAVLLLGAILRLWHLGQDGFGTEYYAAGVRSMGQSWHNFLFNSFDPAGFVSLDKPPLAFWLQVISTKLFGFSGFSLLLPQVLEGLSAIALLHHIVARRFGSSAGLAAALCLTLMPVSVVVDRSGNTDSLLVLLLVAAAWALLNAIETARLRWLLLCAVFIGLGFNTKMLAALVLLPLFVLLYLCFTPVPLMQSLRHGVIATVVLVAVSLSWSILFDLTPSAQRPYAGSSHSNSMLELMVQHNGLERFLPQPSRIARATAAPLPNFYDDVPVGPLRLTDRHLAAQVLWLLPFGIIGLFLAWQRRQTKHRADILLWGGWAFSYMVVFSFAGGIFHAYYLVLLAPPLAALAGFGAVALSQGKRLWLLLTLLLTAAWQAHIAFGLVEGWDITVLPPWLMLLPATGLLIALLPYRLAPAMAMFVLLINPAAWSIGSVVSRGYAMLPSADLGLLTRSPESEPQRRWRRDAAAAVSPSGDPRLHNFLRANYHGERYALATSSTHLAAPMILLADLPVMAYGGFTGRDPILDTAAFEKLVQEHAVRFVLLNRAGINDGGRPQVDESDPRWQFGNWVRTHGKPISPRLWRSNREGVVERVFLMDLHPELGVVAP